MTNNPRPTIDTEAVRTHLQAARRQPTPTTNGTALADIPVLLAELERLGDLLSQTRWDFANLLAAARTTLAAHYEGEPDPLDYLRDEVREHTE